MSTNNTRHRKRKKAYKALQGANGYMRPDGGPTTIDKAIALGKLPADFRETLRNGLEDGSIVITGAVGPTIVEWQATRAALEAALTIPNDTQEKSK